ncbi:MAG: hypothetical protein HY554_01125 [Elusimicrobia bacterium]|nr:hypothetical protein [Elusimicrobiota bacterium]
METAMAKSKARKKSRRRYVLELSERQAQALSQAAELYARLGTGQFDKLDRFFWKSVLQARPHLDALCMLKNGSLNAGPGIRSSEVDDDYRVLYDLHQVLRHRLSWDRDPQPQGMLRGVFYDEPSRTSKEEPLARIEELRLSQNRPVRR